jgi:hypothetical protein
MEHALLEACDLPPDANRAWELMSHPKQWARLAYLEGGCNVIDLVDVGPCRDLPAHRLMLLWVFQLGVKDRASEVRFEPWRFTKDETREWEDEIGLRLFEEVEGQLHELVPPPRCFLVYCSREIESIAGMQSLRVRTAHLLRKIAGKLDRLESGPRRGSFRLRVGDATLDVQVLAYSSEVGERYFLKLPTVPRSVSDRVYAETRLRALFSDRATSECAEAGHQEDSIGQN